MTGTSSTATRLEWSPPVRPPAEGGGSAGTLPDPQPGPMPPTPQRPAPGPPEPDPVPSEPDPVPPHPVPPHPVPVPGAGSGPRPVQLAHHSR